ncbi:hypothetical protein IIB49_00330, partial [Patescibacteria group bacterium]|nr:hypothetical protein [Patescibacteria group bacterium]
FYNSGVQQLITSTQKIGKGWSFNCMYYNSTFIGVEINTTDKTAGETDSIDTTTDDVNLCWGFSDSFSLIGGLDEVGFWNRYLTEQERSELYNNGIGLNPFFVAKFDLTLINEYNSSSITTFTANITNSSNPTGTTIHTTNGTIIYPIG